MSGEQSEKQGRRFATREIAISGLIVWGGQELAAFFTGFGREVYHGATGMAMPRGLAFLLWAALTLPIVTAAFALIGYHAAEPRWRRLCWSVLAAWIISSPEMILFHLSRGWALNIGECLYYLAVLAICMVAGGCLSHLIRK